MLILEFETHETNESGKEVFEEYDWWRELVSKAAEKADSFELRCWADDAQGIAFGRTFGEEQPSAGEELVFAGKISPEMLLQLTKDCVAEGNNLKYFTFQLYQEGKLLFSSEHYGSEIYWFSSGFAEMGFLMTLIKNHPIIKGFHNRAN